MIVWASAAVSLDGYIDDTTSRRLVLSGTKDWEQVRALRAECDAVLVGAETIRKDNPALVTRSEKLREKRTAQGKPADPVKVTVSASGRLDPQARFFSEGTGRKIVIAGTEASPEHLAALRRVATVIVAKTDPITPETILQLLSQEGIRTLFIEGGTRILTQFLTADAIDYLRMATAPFFVGDSHAPRFVHAGRFPHNKDRRMHLLSTQAIGDMSVAIYALKASAEDYARMEQAITLAAQCPPSKGAYSVGAVIVTEDGQVFTGYSRETAPTNHAEEEAILKAIRAGSRLTGATVYSSMEPCTTRKSKPASCSELIILHCMKRVVFAAYEPPTFVTCLGEAVLRQAGIEVTILSDLAQKALDVNRHLAK
ncbi:dihydrofolate reductase family protein [Alistipes indistinctus]|nr:dihydrofolate reductase family protein [Alistipes indistinctus]BCG55283.1 5-amino-6-(5-phosphoribosylamino)uracil reductase [Alistipes indistinctus]